MCVPTIVDTSLYEDLVAQALTESMPLSSNRLVQGKNGSIKLHQIFATELDLWTIYNATSLHPISLSGSNLITIGTPPSTMAIRTVGVRESFKKDSQGEIGPIYLYPSNEASRPSV